MSISRRILLLLMIDPIFCKSDFWPPDPFSLTNEAQDGKVTFKSLTDVKFAIDIPENFGVNFPLLNLNYKQGKKLINFSFYCKIKILFNY